MLSVLLKHSKAKIIFVDYQFLDAAKGALEILLKERIKLPHLVLIHDRNKQRYSFHNRTLILADLEYESFLAIERSNFKIVWPSDERDAIALNYTSAQGGTNVCLRNVTAAAIFTSLVEHQKPEWSSLSLDEQAKIKARQGLHHIGMEEADVKDPGSMKSISPDAKTMGEVMFIGNTVMNGYLKDLKATEDAFKRGWFRTGDLAGEAP
ncbi:hypothetical protein K7X08_006860 [Anisodus acutangulus]|uniref:AMP-dependent synthetase/ligase domain-containing protein n=1 Tax=Anisodus acutangulus TaxID=402998 RepID=A0A9Q1QYX0_9SOLA|nr:hypothetical protein K7X08_006860 [Anisodus acutangulus]